MENRQDGDKRYAEITPDFFDKPPVLILMNEEYGAEAVLLYIFLFTQSNASSGKLKLKHLFCTPWRLGSLCNLRRECREQAYKLLIDYGFISIKDDGTIIVNDCDICTMTDDVSDKTAQGEIFK